MEKKRKENETIWAHIVKDMCTQGQAGGYAGDFVSRLSLIEDTGKKLIIEYPADMPFIWLEVNYSESIAHSASRVLNGARELEFIEAGSKPEEKIVEARPVPMAEVKEALKPRTQTRQARSTAAGKIQTHLNKEYTFDNYVVGANNQIAYAAAQALVNQQERIFNPLFIYGNSGMGKTHLMHAIGNALRANRENIRVLYVTSEQFTNAYIEAIRKRGDALELFRKKFRRVDVLLIDDVQFMARADRTQEEFFHTFNALFESGKQIVLSADCPAAHITKMDDRLKTRFSQGMTVELTAPCYEMRMAILRQKMQSWKHNLLTDEVIEFLARNITQSVRTLEGALVRTSTIATISNCCPSIASLRATLSDLMAQKTSAGATIADIKQAVANEFGLRLEDLDSRRRIANIAHPRQLAMYLARQLTSCSLQDIGAAFSRDHSTVLHAMCTVEEKLKTNPEFNEIAKRIKETLS